MVLAGMAAVTAAGAALALLPAADDSASTVVSANPMTAAPRVPLPAGEVLALTASPAQLGPLTDPQRRAACLDSLGYPAATPVLGARQLDVTGRPALVLVLPGRQPAELVAVAVRPGCGESGTAEIARTTVSRG